MSEPRFSIGIDLGTTHCALAYVDINACDGEHTSHGVLAIPQLTAPGAVEEPSLLPSFLYLPHADELAPGELDLPWSEAHNDGGYAVGELARSRGATTPIRLVSSAKSWLCHPGVDRRAAILPSDAPPEVARVSPLEASIRYLSHLRAAWNHAHPEAPFDQQDVTVTIPASFDPAARELTDEAARAAGFSSLTLLEEPQAALYNWIQTSNGQWRKDVRPGDIILVVDVGGGTSDLSLIAVLEHDGKLELHRIAVGDHILLGGDNMDMALAYVVAGKLAAGGTNLDPWQLRALTYACRTAKEQLLSDAQLETVPLVVPSRGSKLIGGSIRSELTRQEVTATILDGFFPQVDASARPAGRARAALTRVGLPYAQDAAITTHLAAFLGRQVAATRDLEGFVTQQDESASFLHPTAVLFNGGVFKSEPAGRTHAEHAQWLARSRRRAGGTHAGRRRPRSGGRAGRRLLRLCAARRRRAHPRRHRARLLCRGGVGDAGSTRHDAAGAGAVRRAVRHGRRQRGGTVDAGIRPGGRRTGVSALLRLVGAASGPDRHPARLLAAGRTAGTRRNPRHAADRRPPAGRNRRGAAASQSHRSRHAGADRSLHQRRRALGHRVRRARQQPGLVT